MSLIALLQALPKCVRCMLFAQVQEHDAVMCLNLIMYLQIWLAPKQAHAGMHQQTLRHAREAHHEQEQQDNQPVHCQKFQHAPSPSECALELASSASFARWLQSAINACGTTSGWVLPDACK